MTSPLPLPTDGLIDELLPQSSPAPAATAQADSPDSPATTATAAKPAAKPAASSKPTVADARPPAGQMQTVADIADIGAGQPIGKARPPAATSQSLVQPLTTQTATAAPDPATSGSWTPVKQFAAAELVAVIFVAVLAMVLLSRRGRSSVSRNSGTVVIGNDSHVGLPQPEGEADGDGAGIYVRGLVDGAEIRSAETMR